MTADPFVQTPGGVYNDITQLSVVLSGDGDIYYTLDGSVPNTASYNTDQAKNTVNVRPDLLYKAIQYLQTTDDLIMRVYESSLSLENIPLEGIYITIEELTM